MVADPIAVPEPANGKNYTKNEEAINMSNAFIFNIEQQMSGWLVNNIDLTALLDNTVEYQLGMALDAKKTTEFFVYNVAVQGDGDAKHEGLIQAVSSGLSFYPDVPIATTWAYNRAINGFKKWQEDLIEGENNATYNMKSDDIYNLLALMRKNIEVPHAALKAENISEFEVDNLIYRAKGYAESQRVILYNLKAHHYEEIADRGSSDNFDEALRLLDKINEFNPIYCTTLLGHNPRLAALIDNYQLRLADAQKAMDK